MKSLRLLCTTSLELLFNEKSLLTNVTFHAIAASNGQKRKNNALSLIIMKENNKVLNYVCRCALAIPAIIMVLHHAGVFTMPDMLVRITGILILCSLVGMSYFSMRTRIKK